jgi:2-polyprenyl-3-methyl-5-hydroxy-6-metoxy-1,4-benzoquinol methylase
MTIVTRLHDRRIHPRRVQVLRDHFAELLPSNARVLDVGCGDGLLAHLLTDVRPDVEISGIDVLVRPETRIPVRQFDGRVIPYGPAAFDVVLLVDVLHHMDDPSTLLREAARVARVAVVIKDHTRNGFLAGTTLRLMDRAGNAHHGVALTYNYWTRERWLRTFTHLDLRVAAWRGRLGLYPTLLGWPFERSLHFIARLDVPGRGGTALAES